MDYSKNNSRKTKITDASSKKGDYRQTVTAPSQATSNAKQNTAQRTTPPPKRSAPSTPSRSGTPSQAKAGASGKTPLGQSRSPRQRRPAPSPNPRVSPGTNATTSSATSDQNRRRARAARNATQARPQTPPPSKAGSRPRQGGGTMAPPPKKKKKMSTFKKRLIFVLLFLLIGGIAYAFFAITGNLNRDLNGVNLSKYGISSEAAAVAKDHRIVNVLVFGVDGRDDVDGDRSDSTMIASADFEHGNIKISSLMRDTYVYIDSEDDFDKLNAAYSIGGAEAAMKAVNTNFDMAITDYVSVDFTCMIAMVNAVGGVSVDIGSEDEMYWVNQYIMDVNEKQPDTNSEFLTSTGTQVLDGNQALAYCRVRYVGNGDFDRTQRQRTVFEQVINKALALNPVAQYSLLQRVMPYVQTSLSFNEILKYAGNAMLMRDHTILQQQVPDAQYVETGDLGGTSYVFPITLVDNIKVLYQFIYETAYTPSDTAQEISNTIESVW